MVSETVFLMYPVILDFWCSKAMNSWTKSLAKNARTPEIFIPAMSMSSATRSALHRNLHVYNTNHAVMEGKRWNKHNIELSCRLERSKWYQGVLWKKWTTSFLVAWQSPSFFQPPGCLLQRSNCQAQTNDLLLLLWKEESIHHGVYFCRRHSGRKEDSLEKSCGLCIGYVNCLRRTIGRERLQWSLTDVWTFVNRVHRNIQFAFPLFHYHHKPKSNWTK